MIEDDTETEQKNGNETESEHMNEKKIKQKGHLKLKRPTFFIIVTKSLHVINLMKGKLSK